jgi:hypothetical protein
MPWWSWVLIWSVLVMALVGTLGGFGFVLFHKVMAGFDALTDLSDQVDVLDSRTEVMAGETHPRHGTPAIFADRTALAANASTARSERAHRRQLRRDQRITQGKLLSTTPLKQRTGPHA